MSQFQTLLQNIQDDISAVKTEMAVYNQQENIQLPPFPEHNMPSHYLDLKKHLRDIIANDITRLSETPKKVETYNPDHAFIKMWFRKYSDNIQPASYIAPKNDEDQVKKNEMLSSHANQHEVFKTIQAEVDFLANNAKKLGLKTQSIPLITRTLEMTKELRLGEATASMRKVSKDQMSNRVTSFIASQFHYWRAISGHTSSLPDARNTAKQAAIYNDKFDHNISYKYRYLNIVTEANFSPEKTLENIREYHILDTEPLQGKDGFKADKSVALKSFIVLSEIPTKYWQTYELSKLLELVKHVPSGVILYLLFFREDILKELENKNPTFEMFLEIEKNITKAQNNYNKLKGYIDTCAKYKDKPNIWTLTNKYIRDLFKIAPIPTFYDIMLFCSLDGRKFTQHSSIEEVLIQNKMPQFSYWRNWSNCICADERMYRIDTYPFRLVALSLPIYEKFNTLLEEAKKEEQRATPKNIAAIRDFIAPFSYNRLLEITKGKNAKALFPVDTTEASHYASTIGMHPEPNIAPSNLIGQRAKKGGFHNIDEIVTAFIGHSKVLTNDEIGLPKRIELAERKLKKSNFMKLKKGDKGVSGKLQYHVRTLWWLYFGLFPLTAITFTAVASSNSRLEALQSFFALLGGFVGLIIIINFLSSSKK
ncbi:MAG: hypothetical protein OSB62_07450 [Alphaproteobacteria bacterium]|nr:hypothetical protein [Alphaproteobacteria bacterium]